MKAIKVSWLVIIILTTLLWFAADSLALSLSPFNYFAFRGGLVQLTGVLLIVMMSIAMLLAIRPRFIEKPFLIIGLRKPIN